MAANTKVFTTSDEVDTGIDQGIAAAATPPKKKRLQKYKDSCAQEYASVTKNQKGQFHAYRTYCRKEINIGCGGLSDLKSHAASGTRKNHAKCHKTSQVLSVFYQPKRDRTEANSVQAAEVAIA